MTTKEEHIHKIYEQELERAFDAAATIFEEKHYESKFLNLSSISTRLIQECGRHCERFASDFLIDWNTVIEYCNEADDYMDYDQIVHFGIRRDGVDGQSFIINRISNSYTGRINYSTISDYYRKIYAVRIQRKKDEYDNMCTFVTLKDIQNEIRQPDLKEIEDHA